MSFCSNQIGEFDTFNIWFNLRFFFKIHIEVISYFVPYLAFHEIRIFPYICYSQLNSQAFSSFSSILLFLSNILLHLGAEIPLLLLQSPYWDVQWLAWFHSSLLSHTLDLGTNRPNLRQQYNVVRLPSQCTYRFGTISSSSVRSRLGEQTPGFPGVESWRTCHPTKELNNILELHICITSFYVYLKHLAMFTIPWYSSV